MSDTTLTPRFSVLMQEMDRAHTVLRNIMADNYVSLEYGLDIVCALNVGSCGEYRPHYAISFQPNVGPAEIMVKGYNLDDVLSEFLRQHAFLRKQDAQYAGSGESI